MNTTRSKTQWEKLTNFSIEKVTPPAMRAGKAEVRARVILSAVDADGNPVTIPREELVTLLSLVNYTDGSAIPGATIEYDATSKVGTRLKSQWIDFWIVSADPCVPAVSAAASITVPGASEPIQTRPGDASNAFDSQVQLATVKNPIWDVSTFELSRISPGTSARVYVNGLQQIKLKVAFAFNDKITGKPGVPTPEELRSMTIAFVDGGLPLPADSGEATWWVTSPGVELANDTTYDKGFLAYPGGTQADAPKAIRVADASRGARTTLFRYFYVACNGVPAQVTELCAWVKCSDGWIYRTNKVNTDPCGVDHEGGKISQVEVTGVIPPVATIEQYPWVRTVLFGDAGNGDGEKVFNQESVHAYEVSFRDAMGSEVGIRSIDVNPAGMIQWDSKTSDQMMSCYTGYAQPGSKEVQWNPEVPHGAPPVLSSADDKKGVIVLVGQTKIAYQSGKPNGPCEVTLTDWYGNTNRLRVKFDQPVGNGRWKLVLFK